MGLSARIRACREAAGLSVRQLAERAGVSHSSLARLEAGRIRGVHSDTLIAIAEVLEVSLDALVHGDASTGRRATVGPRVEEYPFPAYTSRKGEIQAANRLLLQATGWPEPEVVGHPLERARFAYPSHDPDVRDRLLVTHSGSILCCRTEKARLPRGLTMHAVRLCTEEEIRRWLDYYRYWNAGTPPSEAALEPCLAGALTLLRWFGMRGVSVSCLDPTTGRGGRLLLGVYETDPLLPPEQMAEVRDCHRLGAACEYLVPHLQPGGATWPLGHPRRVRSVPLGDRVISFGWADDLTLAGFAGLAQGLAETIDRCTRP